MWELQTSTLTRPEEFVLRAVRCNGDVLRFAAGWHSHPEAPAGQTFSREEAEADCAKHAHTNASSSDVCAVLRQVALTAVQKAPWRAELGRLGGGCDDLGMSKVPGGAAGRALCGCLAASDT